MNLGPLESVAPRISNIAEPREHLHQAAERGGALRRIGAPPLERSAWYAAYQLYRGACIAQGIAGRVRDGTATSGHAAGSAAAVRPLSRAALDIARTLGA